MKSMTGYAALDQPGRRWELRSVNARGLDMRLRLPDMPGLEPAARAALAGVVVRGNLTLALRLGDDGVGPLPALDAAALDRALDALGDVRCAAEARGMPLGPERASDLLGLRGVFEARDTGPSLTLEDAKADLAQLTTAFDADRRREGQGLRDVLAREVDTIAELGDRALALAPARAAHMKGVYEAALERLGAAADDERLRQDVAALAVKGDVTEEIDRLRLHVEAARKLLADNKPSGRRFDFLTQEFNREANTLCSKAQMAEMTEIGLALKAAIDRLREQVQNVE